MRSVTFSNLFVFLALIGSTTIGHAQQAEPTTRQAAIEQAQAERVKTLHPYPQNRGERLAARFERVLAGEGTKLHAFLESAYSGGGFALGAGYREFVSAYNTIDVRGSYSIASYKRVEMEFVAPRMFHRRGHLSLIGGWRDATQVGFYGFGTNSSKDNRTNYRFKRPYAGGLLSLRPTRRFLELRGGAEWTRWSQEPGLGSFPSVETAYTPLTLP